MSINHVTVSGNLTRDPEVRTTWSGKPVIWVMGDNRENSADSRYFGPVEEDSVIGIVFARYFPFDRIGSVS